MSTGTTNTFADNRDQIVSDALANVGAIGPGEEATGSMRDHAVRLLGRIVKAIDAEGLFLWRNSRLTFTTIAGTASYALNTLVFDVDPPVGFLQAGGTSRTTLEPGARDDYMAIPDRTSQSRTPSRYFIDKTLSSGRVVLTMLLWPTPSATGDTVEYQGATNAKDFDTGATNPDFPTSWNRCLIYGLTADLAPSYNQLGMCAQYRQMFEEEKLRNLGADNEGQPIYLVPWGNSGGGGSYW